MPSKVKSIFICSYTSNFNRHYELYAAAVACLQLFRECNYTGRGIEGGAAQEAVDGIQAADEVAREALLAMGGEDVEEVVVAKKLLYFALSVFNNAEHNICSKSWVRMVQVVQQAVQVVGLADWTKAA